ncbi:hypothetical protein G5V59_15275 [Nocardioides sp. W3-2-3]|uniref:hypothetical protein n=1 Tax=Nocardioides convexus TaxID=2712224 RepID=UPI00241899D9|nr:hypothetical protein [Nocardioides convexus]NHA00828.1 hypothetical protein [Nocardioides convexus]
MSGLLPHLLRFLPHRLRVLLARRLLGWEIHPTAHLGRSVLRVGHLRMAAGSSIGNGNRVWGLDESRPGRGGIHRWGQRRHRLAQRDRPLRPDPGRGPATAAGPGRLGDHHRRPPHRLCRPGRAWSTTPRSSASARSCSPTASTCARTVSGPSRSASVTTGCLMSGCTVFMGVTLAPQTRGLGRLRRQPLARPALHAVPRQPRRAGPHAGRGRHLPQPCPPLRQGHARGAGGLTRRAVSLRGLPRAPTYRAGTRGPRRGRGGAGGVR